MEREKEREKDRGKERHPERGRSRHRHRHKHKSSHHHQGALVGGEREMWVMGGARDPLELMDPPPPPTIVQGPTEADVTTAMVRLNLTALYRENVASVWEQSRTVWQYSRLLPDRGYMWSVGFPTDVTMLWLHQVSEDSN